MENNTLEQRFNKFIIAVSILIPVVVAILFGVKLKDFGYNVEPLSFLPPIYATTNGVTAIILIAAVVAIKNGKRKLHERLMTSAIALSVAFLVMYVAYHMTSDSAVFGDLNHNRFQQLYMISQNLPLTKNGKKLSTVAVKSVDRLGNESEYEAKKL